MHTSRQICLALLGLALLLNGCGASSTTSSSWRSHPPSGPRYTGTIRVGTHTIYTTTRTVHGVTETLYEHPGHAVSSANTRHIVTGELPHVGIVLVDGKGYAIYAFVPDKHGPTACARACARVWPPIRLTIEKVIDSSPVLDETLVSTEPDPENHRVGDRVVKFAGRVVHTYTRDTAPRRAAGQGVHSFGGHWYLISRSGKLVTTPAE